VYDPREKEFNVPASDVRGHNTRVQFRIQPGHAQQLDSVVASKKFPYRSRGDLYRHALLRHLKWLEAQDGSIPSVLRQVEVILELVRQDEFQVEFDMVFDRLHTLVSQHIAAKRENQARRLILDVKHQIALMPDCQAKEEYQKALEERYSHLMKGVVLFPERDREAEGGE